MSETIWIYARVSEYHVVFHYLSQKQEDGKNQAENCWDAIFRKRWNEKYECCNRWDHHNAIGKESHENTQRTKSWRWLSRHDGNEKFRKCFAEWQQSKNLLRHAILDNLQVGDTIASRHAELHWDYDERELFDIFQFQYVPEVHIRLSYFTILMRQLTDVLGRLENCNQERGENETAATNAKEWGESDDACRSWSSEEIFIAKVFRLEQQQNNVWNCKAHNLAKLVAESNVAPVAALENVHGETVDCDVCNTCVIQYFVIKLLIRSRGSLTLCRSEKE